MQLMATCALTAAAFGRFPRFFLTMGTNHSPAARGFLILVALDADGVETVRAPGIDFFISYTSGVQWRVLGVWWACNFASIASEFVRSCITFFGLPHSNPVGVLSPGW